MTKKTVEEAAPVDKTKKAKEQLKLVNAQLAKLKSVKAVQNYVKAAKIKQRLMTKISGAKAPASADADEWGDEKDVPIKPGKKAGDGITKALNDAKATLMRIITPMDAAGRKTLWDKWLEWFDYAEGDGKDDVPKFAKIKSDPKKMVDEIMNSDPIAVEGGLLDFVAGVAKTFKAKPLQKPGVDAKKRT